MFDDTETAQIVYDKSNKVITISADFLNVAKALTARQVFGSEVEAKPDGSIYKLVVTRKPGIGFLTIARAAQRR